MGYIVSQGQTRFRIAAANLPHVLGALNALAALAESQPRGGYYGVRTEVLQRARTVEQHLREWSWEPQYDIDGNIDGLSCCSDKAGDERKLFAAIAGFVDRGSFIVMHGEDHNTWRYLFDGSRCLEQDASNWFGRALPADNVVDIKAREVRTVPMLGATRLIA